MIKVLFNFTRRSGRAEVARFLSLDPFPGPDSKVWAYITVDYPPEA